MVLRHTATSRLRVELDATRCAAHSPLDRLQSTDLKGSLNGIERSRSASVVPQGSTCDTARRGRHVGDIERPEEGEL
jgi:hypothetical protein